MNWTQLYQNTPIPTLPKIINSNFTSFEKYIDIFYNGSTGILKVPIETTGRVKGSQGEFVTAIIDNLVVKNQWTNLYDNFTTADYNYYKAYTELAISPRDPCTYGIDTSLWNFPYEPSGYKVIDVNKPYYKITNEYPIFLGNVNLSQVVGIIFDTSIIGGTDFQILIDPCVGTTYDIDASEAGKAYIEFIATSFDASWGSTWEQYKYGVDDPSTQTNLDSSLNDKANLNTVIDVKTTTYTLVATDNNHVIDASGTWTLTFPDDLDTGFQVTAVNAGVGVITLDASKLLTKDSAVTIVDQYAGISAVHKGNGTYYCWGGLT